MSEKTPKLNKPYRNLSYHEKKLNNMAKTALMEHIFIDPTEYDPSIHQYVKGSERENIKECKKGLMHLKEHLTMCPVAKTIHETIHQVREALRPHGFNNIEALTVVELAYRYMDEASDETNEYIIKHNLEKQPKTRESAVELPSEVVEALEKVIIPEHIGELREINDTDMKGFIRKGVSRVFENWLDAVNEALYTPRSFMVHGPKLVGPLHPILAYYELEFAPINVRLMRKYDSWNTESIEKFTAMAKEDPEGFIL